MQGSRVFTPQAANEIRRLLLATRRSEPSKQKGLRQSIRELGFFISDWSRPAGGFRAEDFDRLIDEGLIEIRPR